ncbi:Nop14-like protein [Rhizodiscina lignyota]|uniref:Nop14-like protein n=1 Tax=Rhizodiscina lignyota TaxID=1504668 RepID=A0A9P4IJZ9_9PEZI|nr:Nop14-like protein [Rhizodiscina lignyota]
MPPSQLKRLKASLREQGITGPQKSKKNKKRNSAPDAEQRIRRDTALASIRESFNPFEVKQPTRPSKFGVTSNKTLADSKSSTIYGRPGVTKSFGEEQRRKTLLPELHRRNKVGGILDRRIGENDPSMTPDERMLQRFTREKQRKKGNVFDLEDDAVEDELTHMGRSLGLDSSGIGADDFDEEISGDSDEDEPSEGGSPSRKRTFQELEEYDKDEEVPERKKTKAEVMKEVVAKSKLYKYERQQAKEDDEDLREELDKGMPDLMSVLLGKRIQSKPPPPSAETRDPIAINPERLAIINGADRATVEKDYDSRLRQMALDKRSQPTERTKTEEEKAAEEATRLQELEGNRVRRMRGESMSDEDDEDAAPAHSAAIEFVEEPDDAAVFGFTTTSNKEEPLGVEDEDDFIIDEELVASDSDADSVATFGDDESASDASEPQEVNGEREFEEEEDELISGLLSKTDRELFGRDHKKAVSGEGESKELAFTYPCPQSHDALLEVFQGVPIIEIPIVIQRIRALYHPQVNAGNKQKLCDFSTALVAHLVHMGSKGSQAPLSVTETVVRHIHSLSRTFPDAIANAFREHLRALHTRAQMTPGYLVVLTAIGTIYPTSDHFHQVVTPAITIIARWLGLTIPNKPEQFIMGAYLGALCIKYQQLSKRYIPELVRFSILALRSSSCPDDVKASHISNLSAAVDLWSTKSAFTEIFSPDVLETLTELNHPAVPTVLNRLRILLSQSKHTRRPLELHHWRPLAIKSAVPRFEESFNPDRHYDPNRERAEASKLRAEYKREKKGALRELRKDANFLARQQLKEKKERDSAYEEKFRKLVAEIQGEEGREKNEYEKVKRARKRER